MLLTEILAATRHYSAIGIGPCHEIVGEERVERRKSEGQVKIRVPVNFFIFVQSRTGHGNPQMEVGRVTVWERNTRDLGIQCGDTSLPNATCLRAQSSAAHTNALTFAQPPPSVWSQDYGHHHRISGHIRKHPQPTVAALRQPLRIQRLPAKGV